MGPSLLSSVERLSSFFFLFSEVILYYQLLRGLSFGLSFGVSSLEVPLC